MQIVEKFIDWAMNKVSKIFLKYCLIAFIVPFLVFITVSVIPGEKEQTSLEKYLTNVSNVCLDDDYEECLKLQKPKKVKVEVTTSIHRNNEKTVTVIPVD